jgi:putative transposase
MTAKGRIGAVLRETLEVSRSGFYAWRKRPPPTRAKVDAQLAVEIVATHKRSRSTHGSPRVHAELHAKGVRVSEKRVARLMRQNGRRARQKRRFRRTTDSNHAQPIAPNLLERQFEPQAPNQVWATDVTYIHTAEGWLYLAVLPRPVLAPRWSPRSSARRARRAVRATRR